MSQIELSNQEMSSPNIIIKNSASKKGMGFSIDDLISSNEGLKHEYLNELSLPLSTTSIKQGTKSRNSSMTSENEKPLKVSNAENSNGSPALLTNTNSPLSSSSSSSSSPSCSSLSNKHVGFNAYNNGLLTDVHNPTNPNYMLNISAQQQLMWPGAPLNLMQQQQHQQQQQNMLLNHHHHQQPQLSPNSLNLLQQQHHQQQQFQMGAAPTDNSQLSALHFHLQREQAFNMLRNGAGFFNPRFNVPRKSILAFI